VPHHTRAVILLGGWLLMEAPVVKDAGAPGGYRNAFDAPVSEWRQVSAHDSAAACERQKRTELDYITATRRKEKAARKKAEPKEAARDEAAFQQVWELDFHARCVPAEHIYPPKEPAQK